MSKKMNYVLRGFFLALVFFGVLACDPCRQLAEQICDCKDSEKERQQCKSDLNLANSHKFFEIAKEPSICEEALKSCSCEDLLRGQDQKCGFYRRAPKSD